MTSTSTSTTSGQTERARGIVAACVGLLIITGLEMGLANLPVDRAARVTALAGLAMTKALVMLMVFMRLGRESRLLRGAVLVPLILVPAFAVALMLDAVFRVTLR